MRIEKDSMGEMPVPDQALWGASTQRAVLNFPISGNTLPKAFIHALALLKEVAAEVNQDLGLLPTSQSRLIQLAAREIRAGKWDDQFPVDVFQTGSGTSTNMNVNEVIAHRASQLSEGDVSVHSNDHVNMGQSSNDVIPSALHLSVALELRDRLKLALDELEAALRHKSSDYDEIVKLGRTHLMDATPLTLGQEFSGYAAQIKKASRRVDHAITLLLELALGGTAVGTGLNTHREFAALICEKLKQRTRMDFREAPNHFEAQAARDDIVEVSGVLVAIAASLTKIANDIRLMGSGPRAGISELKIPATQPGSSIMPGKVNPVMSEMLVQVGLYVQGLAQTVALAGREGHFELNATLPLMTHCLHESISSLSHGVRVFTEKCITGLEVDVDRCRSLMENSLMLVTALNPLIGYDNAASMAKEALREGRSLREVVLERKLLTVDELDHALNPRRMIRNQGS